MIPSPSPALPTEIQDSIIQEIAANSDRNTLKQCSLVCQTLCASSQRALFSLVRAQRPRYLTEMLRTAPHLAKYINSLYLDADSLEDPALPGSLASMSNVRSLAFDGAGSAWNTFMVPALVSSFQEHMFSSITTLELSDMDSVLFSDLTCPNLQTLTLRWVRSSRNGDALPAKLFHSPKNLRSLTLIGYAIADFLDTSLLSFLSHVADGLDSLIFSHPRLLSYSGFEPCLTRYSHCLKFLDVGPLVCSSFLTHPPGWNLMLWHTGYPNTDLQLLDLSVLTSLQIFQSSLLFGADIPEPQLVTLIHWLSKQLASLPPAHPLRLVVFEFMDNPKTRRECIKYHANWNILDDVLDAKGTVQVTFDMRGHAKRCRCRYALASAFRGSTAAGLLLIK